MKYLFSIAFIALLLALSGCSARHRSTTDSQIDFDPFSAWRGTRQATVKPPQSYTSVTDRNMPKEWR